MSHARRKFSDAIKGKKQNDIAKRAILLMRDLFEIEKEITGQSREVIMEARESRSAPIMRELKEHYQSHIERIPKQSLTGKALGYLNNQWEHLSKFLEDPGLPMHNNFCERQIRPFATGRRAWLFSDTPRGAHASATLYSLLITAQNNGLNPHEYMCQLLSSSENPLPFA